MIKHGQFFSNGIKYSGCIHLRKMRPSQKTILQKVGLAVPSATFSNAKEPITSGNAHNFIVDVSACPIHPQKHPDANTFIPAKNRGTLFTLASSKAWES